MEFILENILTIYKVLGILFITIIAFILSSVFWVGVKKTHIKIAAIAAISIFITMVFLIVANAKSSIVTNANNIDDLHKSSIYSLSFYVLTYFARTTIFAAIIGAFYYLLLQAKKFPKKPIFILHKILLAIGILGVSMLYFVDISNTIKSEEYARVISFQKYVSIFVGGIFWMLLCSILAASALPENKAK